jgi:hypothetical protein
LQRGNQRDLAREKNAKKMADLKKAEGAFASPGGKLRESDSTRPRANLKPRVTLRSSRPRLPSPSLAGLKGDPRARNEAHAAALQAKVAAKAAAAAAGGGAAAAPAPAAKK